MWAHAQRDGALPNIGGALCWTPQSLADAHCSSAVQNNAANIGERTIWTQVDFAPDEIPLGGKSPR